jgi:hypothetical protein
MGSPEPAQATSASDIVKAAAKAKALTERARRTSDAMVECTSLKIVRRPV